MRPSRAPSVEQSPETYGALLTLLARRPGWSTGSELAEGPADPEPIQGASSVAAQRGVYVDLSEQGSNTAFVSDTATGRNLGQLVDDLGDRVGHGPPAPSTRSRRSP